MEGIFRCRNNIKSNDSRYEKNLLPKEKKANPFITYAIVKRTTIRRLMITFLFCVFFFAMIKSNAVTIFCYLFYLSNSFTFSLLFVLFCCFSSFKLIVYCEWKPRGVSTWRRKPRVFFQLRCRRHPLRLTCPIFKWGVIKAQARTGSFIPFNLLCLQQGSRARKQSVWYLERRDLSRWKASRNWRRTFIWYC